MAFWTTRIYEGKWSYALAFVRQFVRQSVRQLPSFLGNRSVDFSEIWHEGSLMVLLKSDGARFLKKNYLPWMSSKNRYFSMCKSKKKSKLGIRSVDFSEIWHEGSLMVPPKSDGARFSKKNYLPWMSSKNRYFSMCKAKKKIEKNFFPKFFQIFFFNFFFKKTNFFPSKKKFFFSVPKSLTPQKKLFPEIN